jgi:hypothetical protein
MFERITVLLYGVGCYLISFATFLSAIDLPARWQFPSQLIRDARARIPRHTYLNRRIYISLFPSRSL